ncbi:Nin one binding Zn-ribbon like-domain-containing protein [Morchella snyderi]|nr:Nin one binding Zn-ribbon like-domain-containing protein [Morchella snyderi]
MATATTATTPTTGPPIHALVIDAGPLIASTSASSLLSRAQRIYTTPAVVAEIRDAATRSRLETTWLPFLAQRTPRAESVRVVAEFARRTGDFAALSVTDVQLLALTYELECEGNGGDWRLRRVPGQRGVNGPKRAELQEAGEGSDKTGETGEPETEAQAQPQLEQAGAPAQDGAAAGELNGAEAAEAGEEEEAEGEAAAEPGAEAAEKPAPKPVAAEAASQEAPAEAPAATTTTTTTTTTLPTPPSTDDSAASDPASDSDSDSGWITATNLHSYKHSAAHTPVAGPATTTKKQWPLAAALATTDYAMQNVLLQMNLHLVSPHGLHRIRAIRTWVLRCHACFKLCRDMARQFCPTCGGATLLKTSCSTDCKGGFRVHLKRNMQWNNRGAVYSIPKTQHGSASGKGVRRNLVLREDQVEYQREVRVRARQKERDLLDPDYLPGILTGERREAGGAVPKIGYGRKNPNERQGGRNKH